MSLAAAFVEQKKGFCREKKKHLSDTVRFLHATVVGLKIVLSKTMPFIANSTLRRDPVGGRFYVKREASLRYLAARGRHWSPSVLMAEHTAGRCVLTKAWWCNRTESWSGASSASFSVLVIVLVFPHCQNRFVIKRTSQKGNVKQAALAQ